VCFAGPVDGTVTHCPTTGSASSRPCYGGPRDPWAGLRSRLRRRVCEGAGSPAEINLRADRHRQQGLARAAEATLLVVGDMRTVAACWPTCSHAALLSPRTAALVGRLRGNKFRPVRPVPAGSRAVQPSARADRAARPACCCRSTTGSFWTSEGPLSYWPTGCRPARAGPLGERWLRWRYPPGCPGESPPPTLRCLVSVLCAQCVSLAVT